jgi:hypothetical protein
MNERTGNWRVLLCGSPSAGKKRVLDTLANYVDATNPTVMVGAGPGRVLWNAKLGDIGMFSFAMLHGPGFNYENDIAELFAVPASAVIYVLGQASHDSDFERSWHSREVSGFRAYSAAAEAQRSAWKDVPWIWVKHVNFGTELAGAKWATELIPTEFLETAITVKTVNGEGVAALFKGLEVALLRR